MREIRLSVDFKNLNRMSLKDNYPLPKMDQILQKVVGSQKNINVGWFLWV
jgi:hypothetical protein